jgi:hypothetical protein
MEVLISMFVMSVGLLGLLTLLPLGAFKMAQAIRDDRASTLARSALDDLAIRGYLRPDMWLDASGNAMPTLQANGTYLPAPPYAIDPLAVSSPLNATTPPGEFPTSHLATAAVAPRIIRITLRTDPPPPLPSPAVPMPYPLAERILTAEDDVVYNIPKNPDFRTTVAGWTVGADGDWGVSGTDDNGDGVTDDPGEAGWPGSDDGSPVNAAGDYSWLVTISPSLDDLRSGAVAALRNYSAAAVVFQKRNLLTPPNTPQPDPPAERMVYADFPSTGVAFGGGDVQLRTTGGAKWLDVKPNQWLMLSASFPDAYLNATTSGSATTVTHRTALAWYRIAAVDEGTQGGAAGPWSRYVTLAGPDWPEMTVSGQTIYEDADTSAASMGLPTVYATIFEGVAAVHEQTIKLEGFSIWAP